MFEHCHGQNSLLISHMESIQFYRLCKQSNIFAIHFLSQKANKRIIKYLNMVCILKYAYRVRKLIKNDILYILYLLFFLFK